MLRPRYSILLIIFLTAIAYAEMPPTLVDVITVQAATFKPTLTANGTFRSERGITIRSEVPGKIVDIFFKSGDFVKKDDKLVQLNPEILNNQLKSFQADLNLSHLDYERSNKLHEKNLVSKADYDKAVAKLNSDQARYDEAKARLDQTIIRAPFEGRVGLVQSNTGDYINVGDKITDLEDSDPIFLDFNIPETYLSKVQIGQNVSVHSDVLPNKSFEGKIIAKDIVANPETRSVIIRASIPNPNWELVPGTFATLTIYLPEQTDMIKIPHSAINYSADGNYVYRVNQNKVEKVMVTLGYSDDENVIVLKNLKPGDKVIVSGADKVQPGMPVQISNQKTEKR